MVLIVNDVNDIIEESESMICQDLPDNVNFSIYNVNHLNDNHESGRKSELNEDEPFIVTCPSRKKVRGGVQSNLAKNQELMSKKYAKTRRVKVLSCNVGDTLSVIIPKRDRHTANQKRAPCVIIDKSSGLQPTYRLLSEHGVLNKRFNASKLMLHLGEIHTGNPEKKVSLREVARKLNEQKIFCTCKGGCKNDNCKCQRNNVLCMSRCLKDLATCDNKTQKKNKTVILS